MIKKNTRNIGLFINLEKSKAFEKIREMLEILSKAGYIIYMTRLTADKLKPAAAKIKIVEIDSFNKYVYTLITIGGDGTFISAARIFSKFTLNILPVNIGALGFISEINLNEFIDKIQTIDFNNCRIEKRMMLEVDMFDKTQDKLIITNEIVIGCAAISRLMNIEIYINGFLFTAIRADRFYRPFAFSRRAYC